MIKYAALCCFALSMGHSHAQQRPVSTKSHLRGLVNGKSKAQSSWPYLLRSPAVPQDLSCAEERIAALIDGIENRQLSPDQIITIGRLAGTLSAESRQIHAQLLTKLEQRYLPKDGVAMNALVPRPDLVLHSRDDPTTARLRACWIAELFLEYGSSQEVEALLEGLEAPGSYRRFVVLHLLRGHRKPKALIVAKLEQLLVNPNGELTRASLLRVPIQRVAARRLVELLSSESQISALRILLDSSEPDDRVFALRHASTLGVTARPLALRFLRSLHATDRDHVLASLIALGATGLLPPGQRLDRRTMIRNLGSKDQRLLEFTRDRLSWRGPTEKDALSMLDRLGASEDKAIAQTASRVAWQLRCQFDQGH